MATYGSETGVEAINAWLTGGYTASTQPTSTQVATYLSDGYSYINTAIAKAGYSTPVAATAGCYDAVVRLNNLFAAASAEEAAAVSPSAVEGEGRSARLWARFEKELGTLLAGDLSLAGLSATATATAGGRYVRSREVRRRDGYAHVYDEDNVEYDTDDDET